MKRALIITCLVSSAACHATFENHDNWSIEVNQCASKKIPECKEIRLTSDLPYIAGNARDKVEDFMKGISVEAGSNVKSFTLELFKAENKSLQVPMIIDRQDNTFKISNTKKASDWLIQNSKHLEVFKGKLKIRIEGKNDEDFRFNFGGKVVANIKASIKTAAK